MNFVLSTFWGEELAESCLENVGEVDVSRLHSPHHPGSGTRMRLRLCTSRGGVLKFWSSWRAVLGPAERG